ncbi:MAG: LysR family transcriptional regulator substrate-binding protein [Coriobacteriia bacterium]|nr:LysR family transcriptional regulator substrate-binding protein [Coriobacteriia bacterium]
MARTFAVSGQHYLFDVQAFAHTVLAEGGSEYAYALRDRTTAQVIDDVATGASELGVLLQTSDTAAELDAALEARGLEFTAVVESSPMVALSASHPLSNAKSLHLDQLADWPYLYFDQGEDAPAAFAEEALSHIPRGKTIACTDRASLSELITALNGYTVTSGILVGITDGGSLATVPLETDERLTLGYVLPKGAQLSDLGQRFVAYLEKSLKLYAR